MVKHVDACIKLILVRQAFGSVWRHHDDGVRIKVILNDNFAICTDDRQFVVKVKVKTDDVVDQNVSATKVQSTAGICFAYLVDAKS